jgi:hypothetical protein
MIIDLWFSSDGKPGAQPRFTACSQTAAMRSTCS